MDIKKLTKNFGVKITNFACSQTINNNDLEINKNQMLVNISNIYNFF